MKNTDNLNLKLKWLSWKAPWNVKINVIHSPSMCLQVLVLTINWTRNCIAIRIHVTYNKERQQIPMCEKLTKSNLDLLVRSGCQNSSSIPHIAIITLFHNHPSSLVYIAGEVKMLFSKKKKKSFECLWTSSSLIHVWILRNPKGGMLLEFSQKRMSPHRILYELQVSFSARGSCLQIPGVCSSWEAHQQLVITARVWFCIQASFSPSLNAVLSRHASGFWCLTWYTR